MKWLILLLFILPIPAYADPWCDILSIFGACYIEKEIKQEGVYLTTESIPVEYQAKLKQIELSNIEDGSEIKSLGLSVTSNTGGNCQVFIKDLVLKEMPLTEQFDCSSANIPVNKVGRDAMQNNMLYNDYLFFTVKNNGVPIDTTVSISEIIYQPPTYFAKIENNKVSKVIVADREWINSQNGEWVETGKGIRGNYAGMDYTYDTINDVFIPQKQFDSWLLDTATWQYYPPTPYPKDGLFYKWNEQKIGWDLLK